MPKHARTLQEGEFNSLLSYVQGMRYGERNKLILFLTHKAGMRVGEIASLEHSDLLLPHANCEERELSSGRAVFEHMVTIQNVQYIVRPVIQLRKQDVKGEFARSIQLSSTVQKVVRSYYQSVETLQTHLCVNRLGNVMGNVALAQEIRRWYLECGFSGCSSHSGRRSFVTTLLDKKVNVRVVQELVGHRQLSTTQRYADTNQNRLIEAVEQL